MFQNLQLASVRIGIDLDLFEILTKSGDPMTVEQLAGSTGASILLLGESDALRTARLELMFGQAACSATSLLSQ